MRPTRPQSPPRGERNSSKLKAFADLQVKLIVTAMNRILMARIKKKASVTEQDTIVLEAVDKITVAPAQEQSLRRAEEAILQQIMAAKKGKAYLRAIASLRTHTPILETPVTSDVTADQRRRAISLQLLHQFLLTEAVPQAQILPIRIEDPIDNPFLPTHRVEAFTLTLERWTSTFIYQSRPARAEGVRSGPLHAKINAGRLGQTAEKRPPHPSETKSAPEAMPITEERPTTSATQASVAVSVAPSLSQALEGAAPQAPIVDASRSMSPKEEPVEESNGKVTNGKAPTAKKEAAPQTNGKVNTAAAKKEVSRRKPSAS